MTALATASAVVPANVELVSEGDRSILRGIAADYLKAADGMSIVLHRTVNVLGTCDSYTRWEAYRIEVITGYRAVRPNAQDDAVRQFWSTLVKRAKAYAKEFSLIWEPEDKPKSDSAEATRKRETRATEAKKAEFATREDAEAAAIAAAEKIATPGLSADDVIDAGKARKAALRAVAKFDKDAEKTTASKVKDARASLIERAKACEEAFILSVADDVFSRKFADVLFAAAGSIGAQAFEDAVKRIRAEFKRADAAKKTA